MKKQYSLLLINPKQKIKHYSIQSYMATLVNRSNSISTLSLPLLAALTPDHYTIRIIDEEVEQLPVNITPDIVGITTMANTSTRAYELADRFQKQDIPVILGGPHVSYQVEEGLKHASSIVIGEAETVWKDLLKDFEKKQLKPSYRPVNPAPFKQSPIPRWDLMKAEQYMLFPVQTTRGCPYNCEFCLVTNMFGKKVRFREIDNIIAEINALPVKRVFFVDDNLTINKKFARRLVAALKGCNATWTCQSSIDIAEDNELLSRMAEAGCENILIGFESLNKDNLDSIHKYHNTRADYKEAIRKIHAAGIHTLSSFIVGLEHDTLEVFDDIYEFSMQTAIPFVTLNILGCEPGTALYTRRKKEGRLYESLPSYLRGGMFPQLRYTNMRPTEIYLKYLDTLMKLYSFETMLYKARVLFSQGTFSRHKKDTSVPLLEKISISLKLVRYYLFSPDKHKRELLIYLFQLYRSKKIAIERVVVFLLSLEGFHRYIRILYNNREKYLPICKQLEEENQQ